MWCCRHHHPHAANHICVCDKITSQMGKPWKHPLKWEVAHFTWGQNVSPLPHLYVLKKYHTHTRTCLIFETWKMTVDEIQCGVSGFLLMKWDLSFLSSPLLHPTSPNLFWRVGHPSETDFGVPSGLEVWNRETKSHCTSIFVLQKLKMENVIYF